MKFSMDNDGCCDCERCFPHRSQILAMIQHLDKIIELSPYRLDHQGHNSTIESTKFDSKQIPEISMAVYIQRFVHHHAYFEWPVLVVALVYIERIQAIDEAHRITAFNVHRMVCTAFVLAYKYTSDHVYSNKQMSLMGGFDNPRELNLLEIYTLNAIEWDLHITKQVFEESARDYLMLM
jgi:hypothetical protein